MLTSADIHAKLKVVPFQPFRIELSSGTTYDVPHPDMLMVTKRYLIIGLIDPLDPLLPDQVATVSILHVISVKTIPAAVAA